jgi:protein ImuB
MFAAIYIPFFSLQALLRHEPQLRPNPVALVDPLLSQPELIEVNPSAFKQGVYAGQTASQAMARCPCVLIKSRAEAMEKTATDLLIQTAYAFAANVEATAPGICTMELAGLTLDTEPAMRQWALQILDKLGQFEMEAHIGIASTPALALLAARRQDGVSIFLELSGFISTLPLEALEPPADILQLLHRWGIRTVGAFLALGKDRLAERIGESVLDLIDRVSPLSVRPLKLVSPSEQYLERMDFEAEIETIEPLLFVLRRFVEQLSGRLELSHRVVAEFRLLLVLSSGAKYERVFKIPRPTSDTDILFRTLRTHLENVRTDSPIVSLELAATPSDRESHQFGLFETILRNPTRFAETLARLNALCGPERVGTPVLEATHRPDAFRLVTPAFGDQIEPSRACARGLQLRRFRPPLPAQVELRERSPALIRSRNCSGAIENVRGPFISSGDWWESAGWFREEWDIQTADGALCRIFRSQNEFFLEGIYD